MNFINEKAILGYLHKGKTIEYFLGYGKDKEFETIRWLAITFEGNNKEYSLYYHETYDERDDIGTIYNSCYVEPDDIYGREIITCKSLNAILSYIANEYTTYEDQRFFLEGQLDEVLVGYKH